MSAVPRTPFVSLEEYLARERASEIRHDCLIPLRDIYELVEFSST